MTKATEKKNDERIYLINLLLPVLLRAVVCYGMLSLSLSVYSQNSDSLKEVVFNSDYSYEVKFNALDTLINDIYFRLNTDSALYYSEIQHRLAENNADSLRADRALLNLSIAHWYNQELETSREILERIIVHISNRNDTVSLLRATNMLGIVYGDLGEMEKSIEHYKESIRLSVLLDNHYSKVRAMSNLAQLYYEIDEPFLALDYYYECLEEESEVPVNEFVLFHLNVAEVYLTLGLTEDAQVILNKAYSLFNREKETPILFYCQTLQGKIFIQNKKYGAARKQLEENLIEGINRFGEEGVSLIYYYLADISYGEQKYMEGVGLIDKALVYQKDSKNEGEYIHSLILKSRLLNKISEYKEAERVALQSLKLAQKQSRLKDILSSSESLIENYSKTNKKQELVEIQSLFISTTLALEKEQLVNNLYNKKHQYLYDKKVEADSLLYAQGIISKNLEIKSMNKQRQNTYLWSLVVLVLGLASLVIAGFTYYTFRIHKKHNLQLVESNDRLENKGEKLSDALEALEKSQIQLVISERMSAIGYLASGVAHEINNPLHFILGSKSALEKKLKEYPSINEDGQVKTLIGYINMGLEQATKIIKSLNHFNRNVTDASEPCDLKIIIENCLNVLHHSFDFNVTVEKRFMAEPAIITGNEGQLHQAFLNVIKNAEQSIKGEGTVYINILQNNEEIIIQIQDTGEGISPEKLTLVTSAFFTTKAQGKGVGLGLTITERILNQHHAELNIESTEKQGTTVSMIFPVS